MAATILRDVYDCVVLGSGRTAGQVAAAVARSGRKTLQLTRESAAAHTWLHPRWSHACEWEDAQPADKSTVQRLPLSRVSVVNEAGKWITAVRAAAGSPVQQSVAARNAAEAVALPVGCRIACDTPREIRLNGALPATTIRAEFVIAVGSQSPVAERSAIGGLYRDVACGDGDERQATLFATRRGDEVFWLVPIEGGLRNLWSIGLLRAQAELPVAYETIADVFEEALVACPTLTQRLLAAELVGGLHFATEPAPHVSRDFAAGVISLPEYEAWLDPVFASHDWLGEELASQFALQLCATERAGENITEWRQHWSAVEQLTRERIAPWYQLHETLPAALHDHAQREWYEKLLTGGAESRVGRTLY